MNQQILIKPVKRPMSFYNALLLVALVASIAGCKVTSGETAYGTSSVEPVQVPDRDLVRAPRPRPSAER